jgi:hypothetical protein
MREGDPTFEALRAAIESFAAAKAPELVAEAQAEAIAKARAMLSEAIAEELLARSSDLLGGSGSSAAPPAGPPAKPAVRSRGPSAPVKKREPAPRAPVEEETGCYVYGITGVEAVPEDGYAGGPGVDGVHSTRTIVHRGLAALVSDVPLSEFGEEPLLENLNDVEWLERTARAHELVLDEALGRSSVVPMRLCTIYRGEQQVREMLEREHAALTEALERLAGKTEWGVKMIAGPGTLARHLDLGGTEEDASSSPGAAYLDSKRRQARAAEDLDELAERWGLEVHDELSEVAAEALLNPVQSPELAGYEGDMLLNGVYLVDDADAEALAALVSRLAEKWAERDVTVELTGPWPPYNFVKSSIEAAR